MRWPEALFQVNELWRELPERYHHNRQLRRMEPEYENWDCSKEGFEGIRAQDVLPELLKRFHFKLFVGFGNVVDIFVDRSFGHQGWALGPVKGKAWTEAAGVTVLPGGAIGVATAPGCSGSGHPDAFWRNHTRPPGIPVPLRQVTRMD